MKFSLGAKRNPERELAPYEVSAIPLPAKVSTDISMLPRLNQGQQPACVGHAMANAIAYDYYKKTGIVPLISPRFIYSQAKLIDGDPTGEGTSAYFAFTGTRNAGGAALVDTVPNTVTLSLTDYQTVIITDPVTQECKEYPIQTEVEITNPTSTQLQSLIAQYGVVIIACTVDEESWMTQNGLTWLLPGTAGGHETINFGYDTTMVPGDVVFDDFNSWGIDWGTNGTGKYKWSDYQGNIFDAMAITINMDTPITTYKYFQPSEIIGLAPQLCQLLDSARGFAGIPFVITSGFRTPAQNLACGGVSNSEHLLGNAADIACTDQTRWAVIQGMLQAGFKRIEACPNHVHCDIGNDAAHPSPWFGVATAD